MCAFLHRVCSVQRFVLLLLFSLSLPLAFAEPSTGTLSLSRSLEIIKQNDFRLKRYQADSQAFLSESKAAEYLPDPTVFAAIQNLPSDSFELDQEPMTQLRVGIRQMFPKGDALGIKAEVAGLQSELQELGQKAHWLNLKRSAEQAWLEAWFWQKKLELLDEDRGFLNQVLDFIRSLYEVGAKDQSDLIGAELELIKLEEELIKARRNFYSYRQTLDTLANSQLSADVLSKTLPGLSMGSKYYADAPVQALFLKHPKVELQNHKILLAGRKVDLVAQDFKPAWGMEFSYGLRDGENMDGSDRADFLSAGVSVQLPLFSNAKQVQNQSAAKQRVGSSEIERDQIVNQLYFEYLSTIQQYRLMIEQRRLYETDILPTLKEQRESAMQSYEADKGDFRMVMTLFLKEQQAKTMYQRLRVNEQKQLSSLNYLLGLEANSPSHGVHQE